MIFRATTNFLFFVVTPMAKRMTNKQGGKKEAKLKGKNRKKWPEKTKRRVN